MAKTAKTAAVACCLSGQLQVLFAIVSSQPCLPDRLSIPICSLLTSFLRSRLSLVHIPGISRVIYIELHDL